MIKNKQSKKASNSDWHSADIVAELRKAGWTLRGLSRSYGLYPTALSQGLLKPYPKAEALIAKAIGVKPWEIWPSRYLVSTDKQGNTFGVSNRKRGRIAGKKYDTAEKKSCNVKNKATA